MSFVTDMFSSSKSQQQKATETPTLTPQAAALYTILARYMLQNLQAKYQNPALNFALWRQGMSPNAGLTVLPREGGAIPGIGAPPTGVNPILASYATGNTGRNQGGKA